MLQSNSQDSSTPSLLQENWHGFLPGKYQISKSNTLTHNSFSFPLSQNSFSYLKGALDWSLMLSATCYSFLAILLLGNTVRKSNAPWWASHISHNQSTFCFALIWMGAKKEKGKPVSALIALRWNFPFQTPPFTGSQAEEYSRHIYLLFF